MITKVVTDTEMREIDRVSIEETGIPASLLMNNAGREVAEFINNKFKGEKVVIFCGAGNNGGDGFAAAYYLFNKGFSPVLYLAGKKCDISDVSKIFMNLCEKIKIEINEIDELNLPSITIPEPVIIVDAILGTGFKGSPRGIPFEFIKLINKSANITVSIDIPSGLPSNGEKPCGECVNAEFTVTIGLPKISLVTYPCKEFCGELTVKDIGFPLFLTTGENLKVTLINEELYKTIKLYDTDPDIHKGSRGHTLIVGGFTGMEGAAILTASSIFETGCGLVTIATVSDSRKIIAGKVPEAMTVSLPGDPDSSMLGEFLQSGNFTSMIIGPGLGRDAYSEKIFRNIINLSGSTKLKRILIDGDGLYHLANYSLADNSNERIDLILTPHFLEASRILKKDIETIKNNRLEYCKTLAVITKSVTVLKGPASIISDGDISFINTSGNSGLATAGSGDVLSGIIGALMNMDISAIHAASTGVYIHGLCAEIFRKSSNAAAMNATDIIKNIRAAMNLTVQSHF